MQRCKVIKLPIITQDTRYATIVQMRFPCSNSKTTEPRQRKDFGFSRTVAYDSRHILAVIFQCYGSVWSQVLPYCIINTLLTLFLLYLLSIGIDLTVSEWGHEFMSVLASFLLITKFNLTLGVYYEMQSNLLKIGRATRQIAMLACCLTKQQQNQKAAAVWRSEVAFRALVMLSATSTMLTKVNDLDAWEAPGVSIEELGPLVLLDPNVSYEKHELSQIPRNINPRQYEAGHSLPSDLNLRVPTMLAHQLCQTIASIPQLDSMQVKQLTDQVELFLEGFHGIRVYLNIPLPFSMIQMARIFLVLYVFTMPFAILSADLKLADAQVVLLVFIMSYGFMGLEIVSTNLDDPFGSDPSDLPVIEQMKELMEDVMLMISQVDGLDAAMQLRSRITGKPSTRRSSINPATEEDGLLSSP